MLNIFIVFLFYGQSFYLFSCLFFFILHPLPFPPLVCPFSYPSIPPVQPLHHYAVKGQLMINLSISCMIYHFVCTPWCSDFIYFTLILNLGIPVAFARLPRLPSHSSPWASFPPSSPAPSPPPPLIFLLLLNRFLSWRLQTKDTQRKKKKRKATFKIHKIGVRGMYAWHLNDSAIYWWVQKLCDVMCYIMTSSCLAFLF